MAGNPNPSPETRFKKGQSGNPGGKSEGQRTAEIEAARISAELRLKVLSTLQERINKSEDGALSDGDLGLLLNQHSLKLFKDSEDRAHGTPKQSVDHSSEDGSMTQRPTIVEFVTPKIDDESTG